MVYVERRNKGDKSYFYFVKSISFDGKTKSLKKLMGRDVCPSWEKFLLDNIESISLDELKLKSNYLSRVEKFFPHKSNLLEKVEFKAIKIDNFIESKSCGKFIYLEFIKEFIFNSNNIEGSKIPPERVREIIDRGDTKYGERNEVREVENSIDAFEYLRTSFNFNLTSIKKLYSILTKDLVRDGNLPYPKGFKKDVIVVGNSKTTHPDNVERELNNLLKWYKENKRKIHPWILAFEFHARYEQIHPFTDGNGRTGRLIMNKILMSAGYFPMIIFKANKRSYFNAFEKLDKSSKYYEFMLTQMNKSYDFALNIITSKY